MARYLILFLFQLTFSLSYAQSLVVNGTVSSEGKPQDGVLIDIYEYNSPIQTLHTDAKGYFTFHLVKGKEYVVVVYQSGFVLQSFSFSDSKQNQITNYYLTVDLARDENSPEGLYFKQPVKRIAPEVTYKYFTDSKFNIDRVKPRQRADSVLVLLNRAQANQYILVGNMKMTNSAADTKYSKQIEDNIRKEISSTHEKLKENIKRYDSLYAIEDKHQKATMTATGDQQLDEITEAQRLLAERLTETTDHYLLEQQEMLSKSRLDEIEALKHQRDLQTATDSVQIKTLQTAYKQSKSAAVNDRYRAMDANRKFQLYNKYQADNYQEYIELLRYKRRKEDTAKVSASAEPRPRPKPLATISPADTSDNLSKMTDEQRTTLIRQALEEEERFKNYEEKTSVKGDISVKDIHIADDNYEVQTDKKGNNKYLKNGKPITKITFDFETKRKMVDVLNTIKEVDKYGK
jgi:5-hydroxyisourate hydrolase-like protein (transthyretin family)